MKNILLDEIKMLTKYFLYAILGITITTSTLIASEGNAQIKSVKEFVVELDENDYSLPRLINLIENQSYYEFVYRNDQVNGGSTISFDAGRYTVENVLLAVAKETEYKFKQVNKSISIIRSGAARRGRSVFVELTEEITISGTVLSELGEGIPGATVLVKGTSNGTITNVEGRFTLETEEEAILIVSFVGYETIEVPVSGRTIVDITMKPDLKQLEEVVVVGYGTIKKSDVTGSVASVKSEDLIAFPTLDATQALQGRAAGVQISSTNGGQPGAALSVKIRGISSINASSDPLIVVDGFVGGEMPPPEDIASMEVLKDASATAIYGSRASSGVILVTTKTGTQGTLKINYNGSYSVQKVSNQLDLLNADQYAEYLNSPRVGNGGYMPGSEDTDWQDLIYRDGQISNHQLSLSGGSEKVQYYISGTAFRQDGVVIGSGFDRYSITSNLNVQATDRIKVGTNFYARRSTREGILTQEETGGVNDTGVLGAAIRFTPDLGVYDGDGNYTTNTINDPIDNAVAIANEMTIEDFSERIQANTFADIKIFDWLSYKTTLGAGSTNERNGYFATSLIQRGGEGGVATLDFIKRTNLLSENYFTIQKDLDEHNLSWVNGYSFQKEIREEVGTGADNFTSDVNLWWALQNGNSAPSVSIYEEKILKSYYSRANYSFKSKYVLTATLRYDGASNFAANNKWALFPSAAIAWNIIEEPFMSSSDFFTNAKLRLSYGTSGNQGIGAYESLGSLQPWYSNTAGENALVLNRLENPDLKWETTQQLNIGFDIGALDGRVNISVDAYDKITHDLLFERTLPSPLGTESGTQLQNIGKLQNRGFEVTVNTTNTVGKLKWNTSLVFTRNRNEVLELPDGEDEFYGTRPGHLNINETFQLLREGQPVGVFYGWEYAGVITSSNQILDGSDDYIGGERFADLANEDGDLIADGILDDNDKTIIGDPNPDFTWSINNTLVYKNFDLNIFLQGAYGGDILNLTAMETETLNGITNTTRAAFNNQYTENNTNGSVPTADATRPFRASSRWVQDGSYGRLKNLAIGYTLPSDLVGKLKVRSLRIYASAQNLLTFTKYKGLDPEAAYLNEGGDTDGADGNRNLGLDYGSYPNVKTFTFGVNMGF